MYLYLELWSAREAWLVLSTQDRKTFFERVTGAVSDLLESGSEALAFAINDADTDRRASYEYLALWRMPDRATAVEFEKRLDELGWYDLFDQHNMRGEEITAEVGLGHMLTR
jgi:hypothetical protein